MNDRAAVVVVGGGGHAQVIISILQARGHLAVIFDDNPSKWGTDILGASVTGPIAALEEGRYESGILAIGANLTRKQLASRLKLRWLTLVHPFSCVHPAVKLGPGTVVFAGAVVQPGAVLGEHTIVNTGASVDHDCMLGDYVHIGPGAHLCGAVRVGEGTLVGVSASVIPGVRIGCWTTVGAGAAVVRDLADGVLAVGVPARTRP